jgi:hypothetical protein
MGQRFKGLARRSLVSAQLLGLFCCLTVLGGGPATQAWQASSPALPRGEAITAEEFAHFVKDYSEEDGFFRSDNFVSNETSYLHILDKLRALQAHGGAYIGVGPEQNFTYIAKIRPRIAFIVDIRRQAVIQHLMFKALFTLADSRAQFLSLLFSKPLNGPNAPRADCDIQQTLEYFAKTPADNELFQRNLSLVRKTIQERFGVPLTEKDQTSLEYVFTAFRDENLGIQYRSGGPNWPGSPWGDFPTLRDLILEPDLSGRLGNFLASRDDFEFVCQLQRQNRIIPIVGDFAGTKALTSVAEYLKKSGYSVTAFYTSNVEQYLFANGVFGGFEENVKKLPITEHSVFIRAFPNMRDPHPARIGTHRLTTLLQKMSVFIDDYDRGVYQDYWTLVTTHFIAPETR